MHLPLVVDQVHVVRLRMEDHVSRHHAEVHVEDHLQLIDAGHDEFAIVRSARHEEVAATLNEFDLPDLVLVIVEASVFDVQMDLISAHQSNRPTIFSNGKEFLVSAQTYGPDASTNGQKLVR